MDIEAEVARRLCELTGADATLAPVADHPEPYITAERWAAFFQAAMEAAAKN